MQKEYSADPIYISPCLESSGRQDYINSSNFFAPMTISGIFFRKDDFKQGLVSTVTLFELCTNLPVEKPTWSELDYLVFGITASVIIRIIDKIVMAAACNPKIDIPIDKGNRHTCIFC